MLTGKRRKATGKEALLSPVHRKTHQKNCRNPMAALLRSWGLTAGLDDAKKDSPVCKKPGNRGLPGKRKILLSAAPGRTPVVSTRCGRSTEMEGWRRSPENGLVGAGSIGRKDDSSGALGFLLGCSRSEECIGRES